MVLRRLFRRRNPKQVAEFVAQLERRGLRGTPVDGDGPFENHRFAPGSRIRALVTVDSGPITHAALTSLSGRGVHGSNVAMIGLHAFVPGGPTHSDQAPPAGVTARRVHPRSGLGPPTDFEWVAMDESDSAARRRAELLAADEASHQRVLQLLRDPSTLEVDVAQSAAGAVVAVYQAGREQPDGPAIEALTAIARGLAEGEGFEPPRRL